MKLRKDSSSKYLANIVAEIASEFASFSLVSALLIKFRIDDRSNSVFSLGWRGFETNSIWRSCTLSNIRERAPLADTVRRTSCWRWMIDLRRIILHGYLGYAAPRNIIDVNSRKATARGHKENVETRYRVASTRFSGFPPVNLPRRGVSRHGYACHGWSWCKMFKKKTTQESPSMFTLSR